jgi:hypothetical protein
MRRVCVVADAGMARDEGDGSSRLGQRQRWCPRFEPPVPAHRGSAGAIEAHLGKQLEAVQSPKPIGRLELATTQSITVIWLSGDGRFGGTARRTGSSHGRMRPIQRVQ